MACLSFRAPELTRGDTVDARADVYGLAATLFTALSGKRPFQARTQLELVRKIRWDAPLALNELRPDVSPALANVIARALEKDAAARYADMPAFGQALKEALFSENEK